MEVLTLELYLAVNSNIERLVTQNGRSQAEEPHLIRWSKPSEKREETDLR